MSALPDASATLEADSASAKSRRRDIASAWSDANPDSTRTVGFEACTASASPASMAWQSIGAAPLRAASSPASLTAAVAPGPSPDRYSARADSPSALPSLAATYSAAGSPNGNERACDVPSYTAIPSSVSMTLCMAGRHGRPLKVMGAPQRDGRHDSASGHAVPCPGGAPRLRYALAACQGMPARRCGPRRAPPAGDLALRRRRPARGHDFRDGAAVRTARPAMFMQADGQRRPRRRRRARITRQAAPNPQRRHVSYEE